MYLSYFRKKEEKLTTSMQRQISLAYPPNNLTAQQFAQSLTINLQYKTIYYILYSTNYIR